jgi:hypothetical protein
MATGLLISRLSKKVWKGAGGQYRSIDHDRDARSVQNYLSADSFVSRGRTNSGFFHGLPKDKQAGHYPCRVWFRF